MIAFITTAMLYLASPSMNIYSQESHIPHKQNIILGKVTDANNEPLIGVSVTLKGTSIGVTTDVDGTFLLRAEVTPASQLVLSYVGMETLTVSLSSRNEKGQWILVMKENAANLDEIVVTGYQNIRKNELTGSIKQLKGEDVLQSAKFSIDQMLAGQIAGMMVVNTSGEPGATPKIRIRGASSLYSNKAPLWVLDGIILEDIDPNNNIDYSDLDSEDAAYLIGNAIAGVNPQDIESITVLKDAAATALYGVQAANGVIVVTTKKGKAGPTRVSYSGGITINMRDDYSKLNLMDASERIQLSQEIEQSGMILTRYAQDIGYEGLRFQRNNKGIFEGKQIANDADFNAALARMKERNTDWYDILFRNALSHNHTASLSGGNNNTTFYASLGYNNSQGTATGNESSRYTAMAKLSTWVGEKVYINFQLNGSIKENKGFYSSVNPDEWARTTSRTIPAFYDDGSPFYYQTGEENPGLATVVSPLVINYLEEIKNTGSEGKTTDLTGKLDVRWNIWDKIRYEFSGSVVQQTAATQAWATERSHAAAQKRGYNYGDPAVLPQGIIELASALPYGGMYNDSHSGQISYTLRNQLAYEKEIAKNHVFSAQAISEIRSISTKGYRDLAYGYRRDRGHLISPQMNEQNWSAINSARILESSITDNIKNYVSWLGFASYAWKAKAMLNANIRMDGSNQFGDNPKYRFLPVWSVSGRYILSEENFVKKIPAISYLALRASYGIQGSVDKATSPNLVAAIGAYNPDLHMEKSTIYMMPNPSLRWEKTTAYNIGLDFSLWNKRIAGAVDAYRKKGEDLIMTYTISQVNGDNKHKINAGAMNNTGFEMDITAYPVRTKNWEASLNLIYAYNHNVLTKADPVTKTLNGSDQIKSNEQLIAGNMLVVGEALGTLYSYRLAGLDHATGLPIFYESGSSTYLVDGVEIPNYTLYKHAADIVKSGVKTPHTTGAINPALRYRNLRLRASFGYSIGAVKRLPSLLREAKYMLDPASNVSREYANRWKTPGDEAHTNIPVIYNSESYTNLPQKTGGLNAPTVVKGVSLYDYSDARIASTDNIRMSSLSLTYLIPERIAKSMHIADAMLSLQVTNLFLIANKAWNGRDPEQTSKNASLPSTYTFNLNLNF